MSLTALAIRPRQSSPALLAFVVAAVALSAPAPAEANRSVFVANRDLDNISAFDISPIGSLAASGGSPIAAGNGPTGVAASPDGKHLYVTNSDPYDLAGNYVSGIGTVSAYDVAVDGSLSEAAGSPFPAGNEPLGIAASPDGRHLFVTQFRSGGGIAYKVGADGGLTPSGRFTGASFFVGGVAVSPDSRHLYVTSYYPACGFQGCQFYVSAFRIGGDGTLTSLGSPYRTGANPTGIATSPDGSHLYVANSGSSSVSAYSIAADGALREVTGSPFASGNWPKGVAASPDGKHLYVTNGSYPGTVSAYDIGTEGGLRQVPGSPFAAGLRPGGIAVSPDSGHLYVATSYLDQAWASYYAVSPFAIAANGALTPLPASPTARGGTGLDDFQSLAITPNQAPLASFSRTTPNRGGAVSFDASDSTDPDGSVARYAWDFGDGTTLSDGGAAPTHRYPGAGDYTVTLTLTDDEGCSTEVVHTGQTTSCNGSASAAAASSVAVAPKTRITARPRARIRTTHDKVRVRVRFRSDPGARFRCKLDGGAYRRCSSPFGIAARSRKGAGERHTISIRASIDGNLGLPADAKFRVIRRKRDVEES